MNDFVYIIKQYENYTYLAWEWGKHEVGRYIIDWYVKNEKNKKTRIIICYCIKNTNVYDGTQLSNM